MASKLEVNEAILGELLSLVNRATSHDEECAGGQSGVLDECDCDASTSGADLVDAVFERLYAYDQLVSEQRFNK